MNTKTQKVPVRIKDAESTKKPQERSTTEPAAQLSISRALYLYRTLMHDGEKAGWQHDVSKDRILFPLMEVHFSKDNHGIKEFLRITVDLSHNDDAVAYTNAVARLDTYMSTMVHRDTLVVKAKNHLSPSQVFDGKLFDRSIYNIYGAVEERH